MNCEIDISSFFFKASWKSSTLLWRIARADNFAYSSAFIFAASSENLELMTATVRLILKNAPTMTTNQK